MFRKEDGTCICTGNIDWSTYPAGPVTVRRAAIPSKPGGQLDCVFSLKVLLTLKNNKIHKT